MTDPHPETAEQIVERTLADCGGNAAAALLLLAHLLIAARRGVTAGFLRLGSNKSSRG